MQQALLTISETHLKLEQMQSEIKQLRIDMEETLRDQNDINELLSKEHDAIATQMESINDAIAQLQAESAQKQLNAQRNPIGFVIPKKR